MRVEAYWDRIASGGRPATGDSRGAGHGAPGSPRSTRSTRPASTAYAALAESRPPRRGSTAVRARGGGRRWASAPPRSRVTARPRHASRRTVIMRLAARSLMGTAWTRHRLRSGPARGPGPGSRGARRGYAHRGTGPVLSLRHHSRRWPGRVIAVVGESPILTFAGRGGDLHPAGTIRHPAQDPRARVPGAVPSGGVGPDRRRGHGADGAARHRHQGPTDQEIADGVDQQFKNIRKNFKTEPEFRAELSRSGFQTPEEFRRYLTDIQRKAAYRNRLVEKTPGGWQAQAHPADRKGDEGLLRPVSGPAAPAAGHHLLPEHHRSHPRPPPRPKRGR